jgi:PhnB protein
MAITASISFPGNATEALEYYRDILGGNVTVVRFSETPTKGDVPADWQSKVCWGTLECSHGTINLMDPPPGRGGTTGGNFSLALQIDDEAEGERIFRRLVEGGDSYVPWAPSFFARKFGMGEDRYGVRWIVTVPQRVPAQRMG